MIHAANATPIPAQPSLAADPGTPEDRPTHARRGLYRPEHEHDACGVGFVAHIKGRKSHTIIEDGLLILNNLDHRGAVGADALMGDGAGILIQIPDQLYREDMAARGVNLPQPGEYGVGMIFLPREQASRLACEQEIERAVRALGQRVLGWREVPVDAAMPMSPVVRARAPVIRQIFIGRGAQVMVADALERKLYVIRKTASHAIRALNLRHGTEYFVPSMSTRTVVYKGLLLADQVGKYYRDLADPRAVTALALVHQRFSTNTFPEWALAHPYRLVAHNGEINTVKGNYNLMRAREGAVRSPVLGDDLRRLWPLIYPGQSDTACFDNVLELLTMSGYPLAHAMMMMIPEAWEQHAQMDPRRRAFYEYHAAMMEPWDGPAAIAFTDGRQIGATLDRNGLRPARYIVTDDDLVVLASESGVLPIPESRILRKWRLQPGHMLLIDTDAGRIVDDRELKDQLAAARPYRQWVDELRLRLDALDAPDAADAAPPEDLRARQRAFGYTREELHLLLEPMATLGEEAVGSMGDDTPLAVLSTRSKPLYHYFRQLFAQVTNPPIDPIREQLVMSLRSFIGPKPDLLDINQVNPPLRLEVAQPILDFAGMARLRDIAQVTNGKFSSHTIDICYPADWGAEGIEARLASLCAEAVDALGSGHNILIVSDRSQDAAHVAIPALLALSAIHQHLIAHGLRTQTGLVVETGSAREVHDFAILAGYGAEAVHPYLALYTVATLACEAAATSTHASHSEQALRHYIKAVGKGLQKVMSKMGISTYMSYCGAQIFEAIGLTQALVDKYFTGTASQIGGIDVFAIAEESLRLHRAAWGTAAPSALDLGGEYAWRAQGEQHLWTPDTVARLQHAVRSGHAPTYREYAALINEQSRHLLTLRGLIGLRQDAAAAVPLDEVEPAAEIVRRFATGAMSLGSISTEAHVTLALAMNRIGGRSNTGEGGEDPARYRAEMHGGRVQAGDTLASVLGPEAIVADQPLHAGDSLRSRIKQVASARFGVTAEYLASADQIQIKMAQGAKPGEGGQLPGGKVSGYIGRLRHAVPGVGLISPPPHHDIYSIEDLAQLIHDLKNVNPQAAISVKLVSETGVGTVAAGVAKAKADHVVIAGHDGGTGASPLSSIKHAGTPWEIGLAETQQTLVLNGLRGRIRVQVDGQLRTGRDVVIAALLGADEFGFATAPLVAAGCIMMRKCHLNTCPVGIATQDPRLRKLFSGTPEHVINYFFFLAEEVRGLMAQLGVRRFEDLVGRSELLETRSGSEHWKARGLDFSRVFAAPVAAPGAAIRQVEAQHHGLEQALDRKLIERARSALETGERVHFIQDVRNVHRSVGAMLSGEVVRRHGGAGLPDDTLHIQMEGNGGQSFAAFLAHGITLYLIGDANDYTGKGLSGGRVVVRPSIDFRGDASANIIVGNTVLYGATSGEAFFRGVAGERFAVRNSGAVAVVEGCGDHGCEYMTGGTVVVLGMTGRNFAAGMSGGVAYVHDSDGQFAQRCNTAMMTLERVLPAAEQQDATARVLWHGGESDETQLRRLLESHHRWTGSLRARELLEQWELARGRFVKVFPHDYRRALGERAALCAAAAGIERARAGDLDRVR